MISLPDSCFSRAISLARSPPATLAAAQLASAGVLLPAGFTNLLVENTTLGISFIGAAKTSVEEGQGIALISYDECEASDRHRFSRVVSAVLVLIGALLVVRLLGKK